MSEHEASSSVKAAEIGISFDHPRLLKTSPEAIWSFLRKYDQYATAVLSRANQLSSPTLTMEAMKSVDLKFCIDVEFLESAIALGFLPDVQKFEEATDIRSVHFSAFDARNPRKL